MKPTVYFVIAFLCLGIAQAYGASVEKLNRKYQSAVVMDVSSGQILYAHNPHKQAIPASLVKMMLAVVTLERSQQGQVALIDQYTVSAAASRIGGHQVYLKQGEVFGLEELLKAVVIGSANDAAYAVAEHVAGTQKEFVTLMNQRARELGMRNTVFANVHGLPPNKRKGQKENYSTAYDLALLAKHLTRFPVILKWSSTRLDTFRDGTFQLLNTNHKFLRGFAGADGLKTGYHPRGAGFSMVGTAVRHGRRLLTVVLGSRNPRDRLTAATGLLSLGFSNGF